MGVREDDRILGEQARGASFLLFFHDVNSQGGGDRQVVAQAAGQGIVVLSSRLHVRHSPCSPAHPSIIVAAFVSAYLSAFSTISASRLRLLDLLSL